MKKPILKSGTIVRRKDGKTARLVQTANGCGKIIWEALPYKDGKPQHGRLCIVHPEDVIYVLQQPEFEQLELI